MFTLKVLLTFTYLIYSFNQIHGAGAPSYAITAPKVVKHWTNYNVLVSLHNVPSNTNITLKIDGNNGLTAIQTQLLKPIGGTISQLFEMGFDPQWKNGEYKLHVAGTGGLAFTYDSTVNFINKHYVILIQSDSPMYRPGDNVIFRVIILDDNLLPVINKYIKDMKIYIRDTLGRKMSQFFLKSEDFIPSDIYGNNYFNITKGVTNDISFTLIGEESIGKWSIEVELSDQKQSYDFYVDRYQTPFATVDIKVPQFKTYSDPIVPVNVNCFYTFGKPVNGFASILITKLEECGNKSVNTNYWSQNYSISGQLEENIDFRDTKLLNANCESIFNLTVIIEDIITNEKYFNYKMIEFHQQSIVAKNLNPFQKIKPGLSFRVFVKFLNIEGNEVDVNQLNKLQIEAQIISNTNITKKAIPMAVVKKYNQMVVDFQTDALTKLLNMQLIVDTKTIAKYSYEAYTACKTTLIQIKLQEPLRSLNVDDMVNLIITGTEPIDYLSYYFLAKGNIINSSSITFATPDPTVLVPVFIKKEMAPDLTVVFYYFSKAKGIIAFDSLNLEINGLFQNEVKIKVEKASLDASQTAKFNVQTQPDSQLLILGVDKAVVRENVNSFITESFVINQLRDIKETKNIANGDISSNVNFGSNAIPQCSTFYKLEVIDEVESPEPKADMTLRSDYRKTWIWDKTYVPNDGIIKMSAQIPDSITSWQLSAISIHEQKGLGIASAPVQITSFRSLFIELKLPYSIVRHEKTEILVIIFNYLVETADISVKVEHNFNNTINIKLESCFGNITVKANQIKIFKCFITAQEVGIAQLKARADAYSKSTYLKTDGEIQSVIVKYEGILINDIKEVYLDFNNDEIANNSIRELLPIERPINVIHGSEKVYAMAKYQNIDNNWRQLLKQIINNNINFAFTALTTTCNLRTPTFVQQIYQLNYFKLINKTGIDAIVNTLKTGLTTKCSQNPDDGSIVSWTYAGNNPTAANQAKSSTWMTALFLKSIKVLQLYTDVNKDMIYSITAWIKRQQVSNGEFLETDPRLMVRPNVGHYGLYLTCFVYTALESDNKYFEPNLQAVSFVSQLYPKLTNTYDLVIACYVFQLSKHQNKDQCFSDIMKKSLLKNDMRYWLGLDGKPDIETTAYGLHILVERKDYALAFDTFKYLKSIQTANGMIGDSIQTSIALEPMSALIKSLNNFDQKTRVVEIDFNDGTSDHNLVIKPENEITQSISLSNKSKLIDLSANGYGSAIFQVISQYNILGNMGNSFNTTVLNSKIIDSYVNLTVCTRYNLEGSTDDVVIEIDLPTGYKYVQNGIEYSIDSIDRIETINDNSHVNIFLKQMNNEEICINVPVMESFETISRKPSHIKVYPNNDKSKLTVQELQF